MISWSFYGDRCSEYLFGPGAVTPYRWVFCVVIFIGAVAHAQLALLWKTTAALNAMMAIPNLIALLMLSGFVTKETRSYVRRMKESGDI